jgi:UDP-N-acetylglucosamine--N-acetylmuramyl-(pentapeptide) pyrophosphoryl-undecaprenol N-acetylglucosamine transferase
MAGGTGGHIYPALAVANCLRERDIPTLWLGTKTGLEAKIVPENGLKLLTINISGLRGKGIMRWVSAPFSIFMAVVQSIFVLSQHKPAAVLGMGGFASGPGGVAAWLMRIPLCVHEQNAVAGLTNRLLAPLANIVMEAFPNTFPSSTNANMTGNPVRKDIIGIAEPQERFQNRTDNCLHILVVGGSLGARALNDVVPEALSILGEKINIKVKHQTGDRNLQSTKARYQTLNISVEPQVYIDDMAAAYEWADLVLCRAGAMTVAEIAAVGVAAIFVPYPYAVDDHQSANAHFLSAEGAAVIVQETELNGQTLAKLFLDFSLNRESLLKMAYISRSLSRPAATDHVADLCMEVAYA